MKDLQVEGLGQRMRIARGAKGMTLSHLSEEIGFSKASLCNFESELQTPTIRRLAQVAQALDVSTDWLLLGMGGNPLPPIERELEKLDSEAIGIVTKLVRRLVAAQEILDE